MLRSRNLVHVFRGFDGKPGRTTDVFDDRRRARHGEGAQPGGLGNRGVAKISVCIFGPISWKVNALDHRRGRGEPFVLGSTHTNPRFDAVARDRGNDSAFFLPLILAIGAFLIFHEGIQPSISHYYHTGMRDVFVGAHWAIGLFLLSYTGYKKDGVLEDVLIGVPVGVPAGIGAIGLALFPTTPLENPTDLQKIIGGFRLAFTSLWFLTLVYFSLVLFTRTDQESPTPRKKKRNWVYKGCGYIMLGSIFLIVLHAFLPSNIQQVVSACNPVFWLEWIAVWAFGISWMTKGEALAILQD